MPGEEKMSVDERRKYMKLVAPRYLKAGRKEQGEILTRNGKSHPVAPQEPDKTDGTTKLG